MKKFLITLIIASMLGFNTIAYAAEEGTGVEAGITPDSILYPVDQLAEDIQLALTSDAEKEAALLIDFAEERLAEASEMTEEQKPELAEAAVDDYIKALDQAEEKVAEVASDETTSDETKEALAEELEKAAEVDENVEATLDTEQKEQLEEKTTEISYTANIVRNLDIEVVKTLRESGMGFGQIAHTAALAELSGKTVEEIASLIDGGKGIGSIAKELGLHPSKINSRTEKKTAQEESQEAPAEEQTETTADEGTTQAPSALTTSTETSVQSTANQTTVTSTKTTYKQDNKKTKSDVKDPNEKAPKGENAVKASEPANVQSEVKTAVENTTDSEEAQKDEIKNTEQGQISDTKVENKNEIKETKNDKNSSSDKSTGKGKK